jgi:putative oxidoreductase
VVRLFYPYPFAMMLHKLMHNPVAAHLRKPMNADCAKLLLRLAVGAVFLNHGLMKFKMGMTAVTGFFGHLGIPMPGLMAPFVSGLEVVGGAMLILGLGVRLFGLLLAFDMFVAIATAFHFALGKAELESMLFAASLALACLGAGRYSLDAMLMKKGSGEHDAALPMMPPKA